MDFRFTEEQELMIASLKEYAAQYFTDEAVKEMYEVHHGVPDDVQEAYRDLGFAFMGLPEKVGGIPATLFDLGILTETLYRATGAMTPFMTGMLAAYDVAEFGSDEQCQLIVDHYEKSGRSFAAMCLSEPGAGSDNMGMTTTVKSQGDGTFVMNGQKTWVTNGGTAPYLVVIAKDEDPARSNRNMSLWLIPRDREGVSTGELSKLGQQTVPFVDVFFDDVKLTEADRLGKPGEGWMLLMKNFEFERCLVVAQGLGLAEAALDDAIDYALERYAFEKPIADNPRVQDLITESKRTILYTRMMLYLCLWMLDNGMSCNAEVAMLKSESTKTCLKVADNAIEIFGGLGYTEEVRVGRIWRDLRGNALAGGTCEVMDYIAGRSLVAKYRKKKGL